MERLHTKNLSAVAPEVRTPAYTPQELGCGIVHLGVGAFHRAHQALYTEEAIEAAGGDWGIIGVSLRSDSVAKQVLPQDGCYSLLSEDGDGYELRVVGAIRDVLVAPQSPQQVVRAIADPAISVITLTITEKAYYLADDGKSLAMTEAAVAEDLAKPLEPRTALGLLALGLHQRWQDSGTPLSVISCDNLSANSRVLRGVLRDYLQHCFPEVLPWLDKSVAFPCSMVDRIVPAMTEQGRTRQAALLGLRDEGAIATEPFYQWILEDSFAGPRPAWELAGAQLVKEIEPFEAIKLRLLNASHTAIACLGLLAGFETVDAVVSDKTLGAFIRRLMTQELMPALRVPEGFDLSAYAEQLLLRFANPRLGHRCSQIAMDSSEKIAQRWLPTLALGSQPLLTHALAAWAYLVLHTNIALDDPQAEQLLRWRDSDQSVAQRLSGVLACARISDENIEHYDALLEETLALLDSIERDGLEPSLALVAV